VDDYQHKFKSLPSLPNFFKIWFQQSKYFLTTLTFGGSFTKQMWEVLLLSKRGILISINNDPEGYKTFMLW
jgi:hypothetical protein